MTWSATGVTLPPIDSSQIQCVLLRRKFGLRLNVGTFPINGRKYLSMVLEVNRIGFGSWIPWYRLSWLRRDLTSNGRWKIDRGTFRGWIFWHLNRKPQWRYSQFRHSREDNGMANHDSWNASRGETGGFKAWQKTSVDGLVAKYHGTTDTRKLWWLSTGQDCDTGWLLCLPLPMAIRSRIWTGGGTGLS